MKNKYVDHAHISEKKLREIIRYFALDLNASQIASLTGLSRNTVNRYLKSLRRRLVDFCENACPLPSSEREDGGASSADGVEESSAHISPKKSILFGIYQHGGGIYTEIVPDSLKGVVQSLVRGKFDVDAIVNAEGWRGYSAVVDVGSCKHLRVAPSGETDNRGRFQINAVEGFWGFAKNRLVGFSGRSPQLFNLHLKESEFRYNHKGQDLYPLLLRLLRDKPLKLTERLS